MYCPCPSAGGPFSIFQFVLSRCCTIALATLCCCSSVNVRRMPRTRRSPARKPMTTDTLNSSERVHIAACKNKVGTKSRLENQTAASYDALAEGCMARQRMTWIANWLLSWATNVFAGVTNIFTAGVMAFAAFALFAISWHRHQRKTGNSGVDPSHLIWAGTIGALVCLVLVLTGLLWQDYGAALPSTAADNQQQRTFTAGIGTPPTPHHETIHWNEIFGTTRAVDLVFSLFLDGTGPDDRPVRLKDAYLESASHGDVIHMQIVGTDNPLDEPFLISEANPLPPRGFIRLIAQMNPRAPREGLPNREFLERWRQVWFNAVYEDGKVDRLSFDTSGYFPGLAGPHVTRRDDVK
jgi:hypothetical protein